MAWPRYAELLHGSRARAPSFSKVSVREFTAIFTAISQVVFGKKGSFTTRISNLGFLLPGFFQGFCTFRLDFSGVISVMFFRDLVLRSDCLFLLLQPPPY